MSRLHKDITSPITIEDLRAYLVYCDEAKVPKDWPKPQESQPSLRSFYFWLRGEPTELKNTKLNGKDE